LQPKQWEHVKRDDGENRAGEDQYIRRDNGGSVVE